MMCPLQCGQCCDYWRDVPELTKHVSAPECPHLGADGCKLPRRRRPPACVKYVCGVAQAIIAGRISPDRGADLKEKGYDDMPWTAGPPWSLTAAAGVSRRSRARSARSIRGRLEGT